MTVWYIFLCCLVLQMVLGEECTNTKSDDEIIIESSKPCTIVFQITKNYPMEATLIDLTLNSSDESYLLIKPDHNEKDIKFVRTQKEKKIIINQSKVTVTFVSQNQKDHFKIQLKRFGDITTTVQPTTLPSWPTPTGEDSIYYVVNLHVSTNKFEENELQFKQILVNMTTKYCEDESIILAEEVTLKNINLHFIIQCATNLPDHTNCTQIQYAIPVVLKNSDQYQLTTANLRKMWETMGEKYLQDALQWKEYEMPDDSYYMLLWIGGFVVVGLLFGCLLVGSKFGARWIRTGRKRRPSDTQQIITPKRVSDASLYPPSSQIIPPLFDNPNSYSYFEPDSSIRSAQIHQHQISTATMMNQDDSSDEEILSVNSNSVTTSFTKVVHLDHDGYNRESAL